MLFPVVVAESYGANEFGKYFSILQIASSIASVVIPQITTAVVNTTHNYAPMLFGMGGLLFVSCVLMMIPWKTSGSFRHENIN